MKHSFRNLFMILVILVTSIASGIGVAPAHALGPLTMVGLATLPSEVTQGTLRGVWGAGTTPDIFAVGFGDAGSYTTSKPLIYQTADGSSWTVSIPPYPAGLDWTTGQLYGVWGADPSHVFAVGKGGTIVDTATFDFPMVSVWNGSSWTSSQPPFPWSSWTNGELYGVWGSSESNVYAVGNGRGTGFVDMPWVAHLSGTTWTAKGLTLPTGYSHGYLRAVWGADATHIYAAGYGQDSHSNNHPLLYSSSDGGVNWLSITPNLPTNWVWGTLSSVWGSAANDIYAVGNGGVGAGGLPLLYHFNGSTWTPVTPTLPTTYWTAGYLYGVWSADSSNVYAVGFGYNGQPGIAMTQPLLYRKTATGWVPSSYPPNGWHGGNFYGMWGSGSDNIYAVGDAFDGTFKKPLLAHATGDSVPPGPVIDLTADTGSVSSSVRLTWTVPADDGPNPPDSNAGPVASYAVQYSEADDLTSCDDGTSASADDLPAPATPGDTQSMTVTGLKPDTLYYFAVCALDEEGNRSDAVFANATSRVASPGIGKYDNASLEWTLSGSYVAAKATGPYLGTWTYLKTVGSYAEFDFVGSAFTIWYSKYTNMGKMAVYIDDAPTPVVTINQYAATRAWQVVWTSGDLGAGEHKVRLVHAGPSGKYVNFDAIQISEAAGNGTYDDRDLNWIYPVIPVAATTTGGPYLDTWSYLKAVGNNAQFWFTGSQITLTYYKYTNMGKMGVYIDGVLWNTINQYSATKVWGATWTSGDLGPGVHRLLLKNAGPSGKYMNIDALEVKTYVPPASSGAGKYDDQDAHWVYTGTFTTKTNVTGPYNKTWKYTNVLGNPASAEFWFTGPQITLFYSKFTNMGKMAVYIDNSKTPLVTINQYGAARVWQAYWTSKNLGPGNHKVKLVNAGPSGKYINIDAIQVSEIPGQGTYDNTLINWIWNGAFTSAKVAGPAGPFNLTWSYTTGVGNSAEFWFTGAQIKILYGKYTNMGKMSVYIDDILVTPIPVNQYSTVRVWNAAWTSGDLKPGIHKVTLKHAGPTGKYMNVDAIQVFTVYTP